MMIRFSKGTSVNDLRKSGQSILEGSCQNNMVAFITPGFLWTSWFVPEIILFLLTHLLFHLKMSFLHSVLDSNSINLTHKKHTSADYYQIIGM